MGNSGVAHAQEATWVQLAARPNLTQMEAQASEFEQRLGAVRGYALPSGWFALSLGPQDRTVSERMLQDLSRAGTIPADAFISDGGTYRSQVWPPNGAAAVQPQTNFAAVATPNTTQQPLGVLADETTEQAGISEKALSNEDRRDLQRALRWFNVYDGSIDGLFGPGTRQSMGDWQRQNGYPTTGILTSQQRSVLLDRHTSERAELGLERLVDEQAGISVDLPTGLVSFDRYDAPFVHYTSRDGSGVEVMLISQPGDRAMLAGLYDVLQTLEIIPITGYRKLEDNRFVLMGSNATRQSYAYAETGGGEVKGFILLWPADDLAQRDRVLTQMRASFTPLRGAVLSPQDRPDRANSRDQLAGLDIRRPLRSGAGFFIDRDGYVLTSAALTTGCARLTGPDDIAFTQVADDPALGLSLLRPSAPLVPLSVAQFTPTLPFTGAEVAVAGFPYGGRLDFASLTYGQFEEAVDLGGDPSRSRLSVKTDPEDMGGPVLTDTGAVVGMLLKAGTASGDSRVLPDDVRLSLNTAAVLPFLRTAGRQITEATGAGDGSPEALYDIARDMTVQVACWR
ncbi:hypothetical protein BV911_01610 [Pseudoruegeria sp. SK021]|nr:hypothetical protein BV911_01610 [Pseudoruegeria sp. SK021]